MSSMMDAVSEMTEAPAPIAAPGPAASSVGDRIGGRIRALRTERRLSLDGLAARSGVSRSAISVIERGESSPTAVLLEKLAGGLDVPLASLFDTDVASPRPVARRADQPRWCDPQSGYLRRNVSPPGSASPIRIVEVEFPPGAHVTYEAVGRDTVVHEQIWCLAGTIVVTVGDDRHELGDGDCLAFVLDGPVAFHNPGTVDARYAVVVASQPVVGRGAGG